MWKYFAALLVLLAIGGLGIAQDGIPVCTTCYANIITQTDSQTIENVRLGMDTETDGGDDIDTVAVGNEALSAAIIVVPESVDPEDGSMYSKAGFARIDQSVTQIIDGLGSTDPTMGEGAKGITWNKALQAAWIVNQGQKEDEDGTWVKEGAYISQDTTQLISNVYDYDSREQAKVLNLDNKLAMIVDNVTAVIDIAAKATSESSDSQSSTGKLNNDVNLTVAAKDP